MELQFPSSKPVIIAMSYNEVVLEEQEKCISKAKSEWVVDTLIGATW